LGGVFSTLMGDKPFSNSWRRAQPLKAEPIQAYLRKSRDNPIEEGRFIGYRFLEITRGLYWGWRHFSKGGLGGLIFREP